MTTRTPALFLAHGSPMNAILDTPYSRAWRTLGQQLPRPRAILAVSAHFQTHGLAVTAMPKPRTIHDFGGFPQALFNLQYPAPGSPTLARRVAELLAPERVYQDQSQWGLDHGSWSVLVHLYPAANIPVVQLSLDAGRSPEQHYALAQRLLPLRDEGVMVIGLGNIVHNLAAANRNDHAPPYPWAQRFHQAVRTALEQGNHRALCNWQALDAEAELSVPTTEHYLPLLYAAALQDNDSPWFPTDGVIWGSLSMLSVGYGQQHRQPAHATAGICAAS